MMPAPAVLELLNPWLLGGLLAAAAPIVIHIFHRSKVREVGWGAMRFLVELMLRSRRRLVIQEWLLLVVRMGVILLVALALVRPAWRSAPKPGEGNPDQLKRGGAVALYLNQRS